MAASAKRFGARCLAATFAVPVAVGMLFVLAAPAGARGVITKGMYDKRYCEYLFIHEKSRGGFYADVWNTFGLNDCPEALWSSPARAQLAGEMDALFVKFNGPRHWLIDRARITFDPKAKLKQGERKVFSTGLEMRRLTTGDVPTVNGAPGLPAYRETTVNRTTHFTFSRRHPLRVLVGPRGKRYAMQAYSQIKDPAMREASLDSLTERLNLPKGWKFEVVPITRDLTLRTKRRTTVIQDEFENTYQLIG